MSQFKLLNRFSPALALAVALMVVLALSVGPAQGGTWFKIAGGVSGMAMDDINNSEFSFYDTPSNSYNFPPLDSGFSLSFHLGYDLSPDFGLGFSWDNQYARVTGTDVDVTADLDMDANFFMTHLYWTPYRPDRWELGGAVGMGLVIADGKIRVTGENNVNYGEDDTTSSPYFALEGMAYVSYYVKKSMTIDVTVGWRSAVVKEFKYGNYVAQKEDGSNLELDYSGYILKAGVKFLFGWEGDEDRPNID